MKSYQSACSLSPKYRAAPASTQSAPVKREAEQIEHETATSDNLKQLQEANKTTMNGNSSRDSDLVLLSRCFLKCRLTGVRESSSRK